MRSLPSMRWSSTILSTLLFFVHTQPSPTLAMNIAAHLDHTILRPDTTEEDIQRVCQQALDHAFAAVCIPPHYVPLARQLLDKGRSDSSAENIAIVKLATVIGFPLGYSATSAKVAEISHAIEQGADEMDVVINIAAVKNADWDFVAEDLSRMIQACRQPRSVCIKVIIEAGLMTDEEMVKICEICNQLEPDFVKTSTGFNGLGATPAMIARMRELLKKEIRRKASGGITTKADAEALLQAGADRLGASRGADLL